MAGRATRSCWHRDPAPAQLPLGTPGWSEMIGKVVKISNIVGTTILQAGFYRVTHVSKVTHMSKHSLDRA